MKIEKFVVNPLQENSFVVSDETGDCIFVDPGFYFETEHQEITDHIKKSNLCPVMIANTHCHFDHIMGVEFLRSEYGIPFRAHPSDNFWVENAVEQGKMYGFDMNPVKAPDLLFSDDDVLKFGNSFFEIIPLPGHSPGHVVFYSAKEKILIAGDVLFSGSIGRTDLPGGDYHTLISGIRNKLFVLPDETTVYCGHGPETTLGFEKQNNPFFN